MTDPRTQATNDALHAMLKNAYGEPRYLRVDSLLIDHRYQRPLNMTRVMRMATEFDPEAVGMLYVSHRDDGSNVILDGQTRHQMFLRMNWEDQQVPCFVYDNLTVEDEARIFRIMNESRAQLTSIDLFRAKVVEKRPDALKIQQILAENNLIVAAGPSANNFRAIGAAEKIFTHAGEQVLRRAIELCRGAWPNDSQAVSGELVTGLSFVLVEYGEAIDIKSMRVKLSSELPANILAQARTLRASLGGEVAMNAAAVIVKQYNKGRRERKLYDWNQRPYRRNPLVKAATTPPPPAQP